MMNSQEKAQKKPFKWFKKTRGVADYEVELARIRAHHKAMLELELAKAKAYVYLQGHQRAL